MKKENGIVVLPLIIVFFVVAVLSLVFQVSLEAHKIDVAVVLCANILLLVTSMLNIFFQSRNINNPNPAAVIRGVMGGTFLKLFALAAAALIYLVAAGSGRSVHAVFVGMGLYIIYTWLEVRILLKLNPKK